MRITPGESWIWAYQSVEGIEYLGIKLTLDNGNRYFFRTNFMVQKLHVFPEYGQNFSVLDAQLLNDFSDGLNEAGAHDDASGKEVSINMELSLNAVACARFVAPPRRAIEHAFLPYTGRPFDIKRGQVISLNTSDHRTVDFIVLDKPEEMVDGNVRLMFANRECRVSSRLSLTVGSMIKVPRGCIYQFRNQANQKPVTYA